MARPSLQDSTRPLVQHVSPAYWQYHPRSPGNLLSSVDLGNGRQLHVGERGERWLSDRDAGQALPASSLAPEALIGAMKAQGSLASAQPWVFVGQSGTTYEAESPLGDLNGGSAPLKPLFQVASGLTALIAIDGNGRLALSEDAGLTWRDTGPESAHFADVVLAPPLGLALEVPERLWWSDTEGRSWKPLAAEPFGASALVLDEAAGPVVVSALGARAITPPLKGTTTPGLESLGRIPRKMRPDLGAPPAAGPSADAISEGRAFFGEGTYFEIELGVKAESLSGRPPKPLRRRLHPKLAACDAVRVAGFRKWVTIACTRQHSGATRLFEFFRSEDDGHSFEREPFTARGSPSRLRLAMGDTGSLLATGLCPSTEMLPGCRPQGIVERRAAGGDAGTAVELRLAPAPALEGSALALTFAADGRTAYAVGQRTKGDALFIFASSNPSRGFTARPLSDLSAPVPDTVHSLSAARDGHLSLVVSHKTSGQQLVVLDAEGRVLSVSQAPVETASVGAYGTRALAISAAGAWESLSGGVHWTRIGRVPTSVCAAESGRCRTTIACQIEGCTVGQDLSRVGWKGQVRADDTPMTATAAARRAHQQAIATAVSCDLSDSEWTQLTGTQRLPSASESSIGRAAWFALATNDADASASLWVADASTQEVSPFVLLAPTRRASEVAYYPTLQVEGAAALRYPLPGSPGASATELTQVEVAWNNLLDNRREHAVIPSAGKYIPGDYSKSGGAARLARADLLSIASGGVYVRVHRHPGAKQTTYFLDGRTVESVPGLTWSPEEPKGSRNEMARVAGQHLPLLFVDQGSTVVRAAHVAGEWSFAAMSIGNASPDTFGLRQRRDIAYVGAASGVHLTTLYADFHSEAAVYPFMANGPVFGAPVWVPTQADLRDNSLGCSEIQRASSPRVVAPRHPGSRRPVFIHDSVDPLRVMLSDSAVLHGTPQSPCVSSYDAESVKTRVPATAQERAIIGSQGASWLFRVAPDSTRLRVRVEYRSMSCRLDPGIQIPSEVYDMPDTHTPR